MKKLNEQTKIKIYSVETNAPVCPKIKKKDDTKIFEIKKLNNVWRTPLSALNKIKIIL